MMDNSIKSNQFIMPMELSLQRPKQGLIYILNVIINSISYYIRNSANEIDFSLLHMELNYQIQGSCSDRSTR